MFFLWLARKVQTAQALNFSVLVERCSSVLNAQYASFGQVIEGMEAVDKIVAEQRDYNDRPLENQIMEKVTVETFGVRLSGTGKS